MRYIATSISYALHPLLMPSLLFVILMVFLPEALQPITGKITVYILLLIFITTFIIPIFSILGLRTTMTISSMRLEKRSERILPFSFITIFYGLTTYLFHSKIEINDLILSIFIGATLLVALLTIITVFFKISVHAAGAGSMLGYLLAIIQLFPNQQMLGILIIIILISGLVISARLYLNAHTSLEVYSGFFMGLTISFLSIYLLF